jgi:hypothetical protein
MNEIDRLTTDNNILDRLERLERQMRQLLVKSQSVADLSQLSGDMGTITSGEFRATDGSGNPRMIMSANDDDMEAEFGVRAHLLGLNNRKPQFWIDADDGSAKFARGDIVANERGILISGRPIIYSCALGNGMTGYDIEAFTQGLPGVGNIGGVATPNGGYFHGIYDKNCRYRYIIDPDLTDHAFWGSIINGSYSWESGGLRFTGDLLVHNACGFLYLGTFASTPPGVGPHVLELRGDGEALVTVSREYGDGRWQEVFFTKSIVLSPLSVVRIPIWIGNTGCRVVVRGNNLLVSRVDFSLLLTSHSVAGRDNLTWLGDLSRKVVIDQFVGGANTSGGIGQLGWLLSAGSVTAVEGGGVTLSSAATSGAFGRLILSPVSAMKMKVLRAKFLVIPQNFSGSGNIAVGIFQANPGPSSITNTSGAIVYATSVPGTWFATDYFSSPKDTGIRANESLYDIEIIRTTYYWLILINGTVVARAELTQSGVDNGGYVMIRAYTSNTTAKSIIVKAFQGWME